MKRIRATLSGFCHAIKQFWQSVRYAHAYRLRAKFSRRAFLGILALFYFAMSMYVINDITYLDKDTTSWTSYGFAILAGLSTLAFNWARSMDTQRFSRLIRTVNKQAERCFLSAILFLMSSAFKYSVLQYVSRRLGEGLKPTIKDFKFLFTEFRIGMIVMMIGTVICIGMAVILAIQAISLLAIYLRMKIKWR